MYSDIVVTLIIVVIAIDKRIKYEQIIKFIWFEYVDIYINYIYY